MDPACRPVVMKFGGTSVQDAAALRRLIETVAAEPRPRIVVVSALARVTDALSDIADGKIRGAAAGESVHRLLERHIAIVRELVAPARQRTLIERLHDRFERAAAAVAGGKAERDGILAIGELASSQIVAAVLSAAGLPSSWVDARDVIVTNDSFGAARPQREAIAAACARYLLPLTGAGRIPVLGGFVGSTPQGATTTLGRGGSDYTAALVGAGAHAAEVQIWTDVDGVYTADPRVVERTARVPYLSFHEAYELARFGAKVLHWGTLEPAAADDIPVRVLNAQRRAGAGTQVGGRAHRRAAAVVGLAHQTGVTVADLRARGVVGSLAFLQAAMAWLDGDGHGATVISLSPTRLVAASADAALIERLVSAVQDVATASVSRNAGLVAVVGDGIACHASAWRVVNAVRNAGQVDAIVTAQSGDALVCITSRHAAPPVCQTMCRAAAPAPSARQQKRRRLEVNGETTGSIQAGAGV